jgi:hypothetical protein
VQQHRDPGPPHWVHRRSLGFIMGSSSDSSRAPEKLMNMSTPDQLLFSAVHGTVGRAKQIALWRGGKGES